MNRIKNINGFGLIEITIIIITIGILASIAMQSMTALMTDARQVKTQREMDLLADAIVGNADISSGTQRADFGYIGDIGSFPPNLDALVTNPGGYTTWDGPYISTNFTQDTDGYKTDEWGTVYSYNGGLTITSNGSGSSITKKIADAASDYTLNRFTGTVLDASGTVPGITYLDSVNINVTIPNGSGGTITKSYVPDSSGLFILDSLPVGNHPLSIIFTPNVDTLYSVLTILPRHKTSRTYKFALSYFTSAIGSGSSGVSEPPDLVGHWKFDETNGIIASDNSVYSNFGTLINMDSTTDWITGKISNALDFDGSNDYVSIPYIPELNGTTQLTYTAWVYPRTWSGSIRQIMAKSVHGGGSGRAQMGIFSESNLLKGRAETTAGRYEVTTALPVLNTWNMVALVFDSVSLTLYVNDTIVGVTLLPNTSLVQNSDDLNISKRVGTNQYFFNGGIDDVRVYNRALSTAEINYLFNLSN